MVNLGFMLPTDEVHENKLKELSKFYEMSEEEIINDLIDNFYKITFKE